MTRSPGLISGAFAGRHTIERVLGRGATSIVYLAHDNGNGRADGDRCWASADLDMTEARANLERLTEDGCTG